MKHFSVLLIVSMLIYVLWVIVPIAQRTPFLATVKRHAWPLVAIVLVLLAGLVAAVYLPALNLI